MTASAGLHHLTDWLLHRGDPSERTRVQQDVLDRARRAVREGKLELARALVEESAEYCDRSAACLNLLGLVAEARDDWPRARKCWGKALRLDPSHSPAADNLRRYFELFQWGCSRTPVAFGDEPQFAAPVPAEKD